MDTRIPVSLDPTALGRAQRPTSSEAKQPSTLAAVPAGEQQTTPRPRGPVEMQAAVVEMNDFVQSVNRNINFDLEEGSGQVVVNVTDRETGTIIRQIPSEEALQLAESLSEARSLLFKTEA